MTTTRKRDTEPAEAALQLRQPTVADGAAMWRLARDSGGLDLNTSYAYLLFAHDFAATCRIADLDGHPAGFVLGYLRPALPDRLFVWQVTTSPQARGRSLAGRMLRDLLTATGARFVEATITADNAASHGLFGSLTRGWPGAEVHQQPLFDTTDFPDGQHAEALVTVGPFDPAGGR